MDRAGRLLLGRHDFHSFETDWPNRTSSVRTILDLTVERAGAFVTIEVEADGFLYNMVRSIAGTLVLVGTGKRPEAWVADVLAAENRVVAGPTAPPQGLVPGQGPLCAGRSEATASLQLRSGSLPSLRFPEAELRCGSSTSSPG